MVLLVERLAWLIAGTSVCVLAACGDPPREGGGDAGGGGIDTGDAADAGGQVEFDNLPATVEKMRGEEGTFDVEARSSDGSAPQLEVVSNGCPFDVAVDPAGTVSWVCGTEQPAECDVTLGASGDSAQGTLSLVCTNSVPEVAAAAVSPEEPTLLSELRCAYDFSDGDSDPDRSQIEWFRGGDPAGSGPVYTGERRSGDVISCRVTPDDGWDSGSPVESPEVTVGNVSARSLGDLVQGSPALIGAAHATRLGDAVYFAATHESLGQELWRVDLTTRSTTLVRDIMDGPGDGVVKRPMAVVGTTLYFSANDGVHGHELWRTDGTTQGTVRVSDAVSGLESGRARSLTVFDQTLYFITQEDGSNSGALWRVDPDTGQPENVQSYVGGYSKLDEGAEFGGDLYFSCQTSNKHLCRLSPSEGVTLLNTTASGASVANVVATDQAVYFTKGRTLWRSDGTQAGTQRWGGFGDVIDLFVHQGDLYVSEISSSGGTHDHTIYRYQEANSGQTTLLAESSTGNSRLYSQFFGAVSGGMIFKLPHPDNNAHSLWVSDGTRAGTTQLADDVFVGEPTRDGDTFYFSARPSSSYYDQIWRTDGTAANTGRLGTSAYDDSGVADQILSAAGGLVLIDPHYLDTPSEVVFAGTSTSTKLTADDIAQGSFPQEVAVMGRNAVISVRNGAGGYQLMYFDHTAGTVTEIDHQLLGQALALGEPATWLTSVGDRVYFRAGTSDSQRLWWTDGTGQGTDYLLRTAGGNSPELPSGITALGDRVVFKAHDPGIDSEPWVSDGTEQGSMLLANIDEHVNGGSSPSQFTRLGDQVYFLANDDSYEGALWVTDGTPDGTQMISSSMDYRTLQKGGDTLYFSGETNDGKRIGRYDAATGQTELFPQLPDDHDVGEWVAAGDTVFVIDRREDELVWRLDDGTFTQVDGEPYSTYRNSWMVGAEGRAFWLRSDDGMWSIRSAGSSSDEATDILGQLPLRPRWMYPIGGRVLFEAPDGGVSRLFISDGTAEGTRPLLSGASELKNIQVLARSQHGLFVSAYTSDQGQELWLIE